LDRTWFIKLLLCFCERFALAREDGGTTCLLSHPFPGVTTRCYLLGTDVALAVKKVGAIGLGGSIVTDDFDSPHIHGSDAAIGGVQHEKPTGHPFIHIAGQNLHGGGIHARDGMPLVDPLADKDLQKFVLGPWPDKMADQTALHGRHGLR
jgi:hypothetical protein